MRLIVVAIALCAFAPTARAQQTDVIRGRIVGADSAPLRDVNVKATSYQGGVAKTAKTDKDGRYNIVFLNGEGDYWIDLQKVGYSAKRFEIRRIGDEQVLIANGRMTDAAAKLGAMEVVGDRNRKLPPKNATDADVSGGAKALVTNDVPPDQQGNLAAMAAAAGFQIIPGLDGASDAFSALGLSGDQNNTTFAGLGSGVTALPPDILATTSINPYPFDVSLGGFSGAQVTIQTIPGTNFSRRALSTNAIFPSLEWGNQSALAQGRRYTNLRLGGNAAGPLAIDKVFYNTAYNFQRQFSDLQTLLNTSALGLTAAGVAPDSAARLVGILRDRGIPIDRAGLPDLLQRDAVQLSGNMDTSPSGSGAGHSFTFGGAGSYNRMQPVGRGSLLLGTPSHSGETSFWGANLTAAHANYFWFGVLSKTTLGFAASGSSTSPYEDIPEGSVRVSSLLPDGSASVKSLAFGGASSATDITNRALQLTNQLTWFSVDNKHSLKVMSSVMRDEFRADVSPSLLGTFNYNSLADLDAGLPASYTRTLDAAPRQGSQLSGALSIGDSWRPTTGLQVQYGMRADGNHFISRPDFNQNILNTFATDNAFVPNRVYVSPRLGMQWFYGHSDEVEYAPGSARPPRAVIHAGAGVFQNMSTAQLIATAVGTTGLPGSTRSITCVGSATPAADWDAFLTNPNAIPDRCADGSTGSVFANASPNVVLFDRSYRQPRSLRGAADWSGPVLDNRFVLGLQTIISSGLDQSGQYDINLDSTPRFNLSNEANRPIYVDPSAIVAMTGAVGISGSRVSNSFQHVWATRSGLEVPSKQFNINVKPITANPYLHWEATYNLLDAHETFTGFTSTAGNPFDVESGRSLQGGRHTVYMRWYDLPIHDLVYVSAYVRFMSGAHFTPLVANDINGDGMINDRAFIADPASVGDSTLRAGMQSLLASGPSSVRDCLRRQVNALSSRGSCQTGWTTNAMLALKFNPQKIGLPKRASLTLTVSNPIALTDLALHGSNNLRGWGQDIPPDQNLLFVRGFDATTKQFKYEVNQRFGSTRPQQSSVYALPFLSLGLSIDIGVARERQLLTQRLDVGRRDSSTKATSIMLAGFGLQSLPNPMRLILAQSDSLKLTRAQADSLADLSKAYAAFADSVWMPVGRYLAALPDNYSTGDAFSRYSAARAKTVDYLLMMLPQVKSVLTPAQTRRLPPLVANYLDERVLKFLRTSSVGDASSLVRR
ncbi:MAG TPA: carboxypeptidase-like regulatory domain-containing protein [Gemmatimonadaceae bacterium]|jgi:hypothetical protein